MRRKILVIDDEPDIVEFVEYNLRKEQFQTSSALDGLSALKAVREFTPDLILLDLMLPGVDGLEICRQIRADKAMNQTPIIMLTAKGEEADIVTGLEIGADDYVSKPFSMRLLLARIRSVLRRSNPNQEEPSITQVEGISINDEHHEVHVGDSEIQLTLMEYKLLRFLAQHPGRVFTRTQILSNIQDEQVLVVDRAIDVHVAALRRKLGLAGSVIKTVRGVGYRLQS